MEPQKFGVVTIQFFDDVDQANYFHNEMIEYELFQDGTIPLEFYNVTKKQELFETFEKLIQKIIDENYFFFLQINSHGCENGMGANLKEMITWEELFFYTRRINELFNGALVIMLAVCTGNAMIQAIEPSQRAPFGLIIGAFIPISFEQAKNAFNAFYRKPFPDAKYIRDGIEKMNKAVGKTSSPLFYGINKELCFDKICDPDRDPAFFKSIVYQQVLRITKTKGMTDKLFCEVVESVDNDIRGYLSFTWTYFKNYFLFRD